MTVIKTILIGFLTLLILITLLMMAFIFIGVITLFWKEILAVLVTSTILGILINLTVKERGDV